MTGDLPPCLACLLPATVNVVNHTENGMRVAATVGLLALAALVAGAAFGDPQDPVAARQQLMKTNNAQAKAAFAMIKGTTPYDPKAAAAAMTQIATDMTTFVTLFPAGSGDDPGTYASPDIWTHMDDFKALAAKLQTDATAAATVAPTGVGAFKTAFATVNGDCNACHQKYREQD